MSLNFDPARQGLPDQGHHQGSILLSQGHRSGVFRTILRAIAYINLGPDGQGETSPSPRSLKEGELGEWILLDAVGSMCYGNVGNNLIRDFILQTPASCSNIALHNLFPGEIDLVVSILGIHLYDV
jgi:hypothetical protein